MKIFQTKAKLLKNIAVALRYYKILLSCSQIAKTLKPGQFIHIKVSDGLEPLLRRPLSIHRVIGENIELLYEVVGKGTEILSKKKAGECLDIIGPLGNGFNYDLPLTTYRLPILVAGGMGVAPLVFLAERLAYSVERRAYRKNKRAKLFASAIRHGGSAENFGGKRYPLNAIVLIGAKTKAEILCAKEFEDLGYNVKISTNDGSGGFKGKVTELLKEILLVARRTSHVARQKRDTCYVVADTQIYACGPQPMLKEVAAISKKYNIPAQVSLEEHMACGIGACLGCVIRTRQGFKRVCKEGPVFYTEEIIW